MGSLPRELTQISRSDVTGQNVTGSGAARYFDYESAVALRNLAAAYGTDMPRYLLAPEVAVLLSKVPDLKKRLFIDTLWNTGGRLNEILPLTGGGFCAGRSAHRRPAEFTVRGAAHPQAAEAGRGGPQPPARASDKGRAAGRT